MTMEGISDEHIDDVDQARAMAEASDEAHSNAASLRSKLLEHEPVIATTRDGIRFEIKDPNIESKKDDLRYWEQEAKRDEANAKPAASLKDQMTRWFRN